MRFDVIDLGSKDMLTSRQALGTPWFLRKLSRAHRSPLRTVVQLLDCRITVDALGGMHRTSTTLDQYVAAWIGAFAQGLIWQSGTGPAQPRKLRYPGVRSFLRNNAVA